MRVVALVMICGVAIYPFVASTVGRAYGLEEPAPVQSQSPSEEPSPSADPTPIPSPAETAAPDAPVQEEEPPQDPCTWDGRTVEDFRPGWWTQEQARFHGFHVLSGVVINIVMLIMTMNGVFERRGHYLMIEKAGLYWHFVDLVWVFVFLCFYLI